MKKLLVLTNVFPYSHSEQYMETEEKYYTRFDKVWIAALGLTKTYAGSRRDLQSQAEVIPVRAQSGLFYYLSFLAVLGDRNLYKELFELKRTHRLTKQRIWNLIGFLIRAHYDASLIDQALKKEDKTDILIYAYRFERHAYIALLLRKKWGKQHPIVCRAHGYDLYEERSVIQYIPMRSVTLNEVDDVFPCSKCGVEYIKNRYPRRKARVDVRYLGTVDHGEKIFASAGKRLSIVSCSNVLEVKRIDRIVDALSMIDDIPIEWVHYGEGELLDEIRAYAGDRLPQNVRASFPGNLPNTELLSEYASKDYYVLLNVSSSEGLPVSIMEAMSFGIPCIATDVGGTGEIVNESNGVLVSKEASPGEISDAIRFVYSMNDADYLALRRRARASWKERFDAEENYSAFIEELLTME